MINRKVIYVSIGLLLIALVIHAVWALTEERMFYGITSFSLSSAFLFIVFWVGGQALVSGLLAFVNLILMLLRKIRADGRYGSLSDHKMYERYRSLAVSYLLAAIGVLLIGPGICYVTYSTIEALYLERIEQML